jgi:hypothetical protein
MLFFLPYRFTIMNTTRVWFRSLASDWPPLDSTATPTNAARGRIDAIMRRLPVALKRLPLADNESYLANYAGGLHHPSDVHCFKIYRLLEG